MKITLDLTLNELRALKELAEEYLDEGPAFECMQEWDEPHKAEDLVSLKDKILKETR